MPFMYLKTGSIKLFSHLSEHSSLVSRKVLGWDYVIFLPLLPGYHLFVAFSTWPVERMRLLCCPSLWSRPCFLVSSEILQNQETFNNLPTRTTLLVGWQNTHFIGRLWCERLRNWRITCLHLRECWNRILEYFCCHTKRHINKAKVNLQGNFPFANCAQQSKPGE